MNYWHFIKIKSFCTAKETVDKPKKQPTEWEKIFANDMSDKELLFKTYKERRQRKKYSGKENDQDKKLLHSKGNSQQN